jgi:sugar phosphate isomerase/epimerase
VTASNAPKLSAFADESSDVFSEQIDAVVRNGFTHIELRNADGNPPHKHDLETIKGFKQAASDAGIGFSAVGSPLGKCSINDDIQVHVDMCKRLVEVAHILGTPYIRMFSFRIPKEENADDYRQQVIDNLGKLVDVVDGTGVMLAHENEHGIYGDIGRRCRDLYDTFYGTGCFKGVFDFANFLGCGDDPMTDCWPLLKDYTEYFHIKDRRNSDGNVVPAGQGEGNMKKILGEAISGGFSSFLTLEPHVGEEFGETSEARFDCAAQSLVGLLKEIGC